MNKKRKPRQLRLYRPDDLLTHGIKRGELLFEHLSSMIDLQLHNCLVDVGCGYGGLTLAWAQKGKCAIAIDLEWSNVEILKGRIQSGEAQPGNVHIVLSSASDLPLCDSTADIAIMIGVLEWVGYASEQEDPRSVQLAALKQVRRILRPGGIFLLGTKNRTFPRYVWSDGQLNLPFVNILPRRLANLISQSLRGFPYRGYIYTYWGWKRLLSEAGFELLSHMVPIFDYQFPLFFAPPWKPMNLRKVITQKLSQISIDLCLAVKRDVNKEFRFKLRRKYYEVFGALGLLGIGGGSFFFLCRNPGNEKKIEQ